MADDLTDMDSVIRIPFGNSNTTDSAPRRPRRISDPKLIRKIRAANGRAKRVFDILVAASAMIFLLPALITIALAVKLGDGGPILYRHRRVGRQGQRFDCLKFRSMAVDSEQRLARLLLEDPHAAQEWQAHQKLNNDPRVTALGNFLRKTSLDELPQLWNVLVGEMSLIGPRPVARRTQPL
ncbi:MAG: sugar transferase [Hyphomonadaceae bacterium]